jgi:hypothetical protein
MPGKNQKGSCVSPASKGMTNWKVESIISIELRDKAKIHSGDKLALVSWEKEGEICCLYLIKTEHLAEQVKGFLGPMMKEMAAS